MRIAHCLLAMMLMGCAHMDPPALAVGQAWRFLDAPSEDARIVIERIETRGDRRVVHASVVDLPMPPKARDLIARMEERRLEVSPEPVAENPPTQIILSGMLGAHGEWYSGSLLLDKATGVASIPHLAMYEDDLRSVLTELTDTERAPGEHFAFQYQLWEQGEREWPSLHDSELPIPLADRVRGALGGVPELLRTLENDAPASER